MPTYTVHEPHPVADDIDQRATRLVFVKEGFAWLAFIAPMLWLLFNWMWREFLGYIVLNAIIAFGVRYAGGNAEAVAWSMLAVQLAFGFEARNFYRAALARKGYQVIGVVTGRDQEDSERRFLSEWLPSAKARPAAAEPDQPMPLLGAPATAG